MNIIEKLYNENVIAPPEFVAKDTQYITIMGSHAYGVSMDNSDLDVYGFCIPPKEVVFPYLQGEIQGFGKQVQRFEQYQQHHIKYNQTEYDFNIFNIVKYFQLCMDNNPNMIDSLFTHETSVMYQTNIAKHIRENRHIFLHKGAWHRFKGYAYSQKNKAKTKTPDPNSKRYASVQKYGYDVKFAYHIVRLINEVEQILVHHDIDLRLNNRQLISIRNGEWTWEDIETWFFEKELELEKLYINSKLPKYPDETKIKKLLLECLEEHYGDLSSFIVQPDKYRHILQDIRKLTECVR